MQFLLLIFSCTACVKPAQIAALLNRGYILNTILCQQTFGCALEYIGTHVAPTNVEPTTCCIWADALPCPALPCPALPCPALPSPALPCRLRNLLLIVVAARL